jgi:hypothetical protein
MDYEQLWQRIIAKIKTQPPTGKKPNEFFVDTVLQPIRNRVQVNDDHLMRLSANSDKPQRIAKDDVIYFAKQAVDSDDHIYSIADPTIKPGRMGSIICSMLHLLNDEFEYQPGRILVYKGG